MIESVSLLTRRDGRRRPDIPPPDVEIDGIAELWYDDRESMARALDSAEAKAPHADGALFIGRIKAAEERVFVPVRQWRFIVSRGGRRTPRGRAAERRRLCCNRGRVAGGADRVWRPARPPGFLRGTVGGGHRSHNTGDGGRGDSRPAIDRGPS